MASRAELVAAIKAVNEASATFKEVSQDLGELGDDAEENSGKLGKVGESLKNVGEIAAGFVIGKALTEAPAFFSGLAEDAAELELQIAKAETVFGDSLPVIQTWAEESAHAMGLTKTEATTLATSMGDLLIPMGFTREEAAKMSSETLDLAGALAEWSGGQFDASETGDILTKAMLGERDGLKALGISISEADVKAKLLEKGQEDLTGAALEQAKATATLELVMEKSTDAQDAFAEGSDTMARRQAEATAKQKEAKEVMARELGPIIAEIQILLATGLVPALELASEFFGAVAGVIGFVVENFDLFLPVLAGVGGAVMLFAATQLPALIAATWGYVAALTAQAIAFIAANAPMIALGVGIAALIAGIVLLVQHWDTIVEKVPFLSEALEVAKDVFFKVRDAAVAVFEWLRDNWELIATILSGPFAPLVLLATDAFGVRSALEEAFQAVLDWLTDTWSTVSGLVTGPLDAVVDGASDLWGVKSAMTGAFEAALTFVTDTLGWLDGIKDTVLGPFTGEGGLMKEAADLWGLKSAFTGAFDAAKTWVSDNWPIIATIISGPFAPLVLLATDAFGVRSELEGAFTSIKNVAEGVVDDIVGFFGGLPNRLLLKLGAIKDAAEDIGQAIVDGIVDGVNKVAGVVGDIARGLLQAIEQVVNSAIDRINQAIPNDLSISAAGVTIGVDLPDNPIGHISLAHGGIVTGSTLALIGDNPSGREAVVPLERAGEMGFGGGGRSIHIGEVHIHEARNGRETLRVFDRELRRLGIEGGLTRGDTVGVG